MNISTFSVPPNESERLEALHSIGILDTPPQDMFDRITSILARVLEVPICLVSLVDTDRQWFKSNLGLGDTFETHRNEAFCGHAIMPGAPEVLVVHDTVLDSRFRDNLLVTGPPFIRFYAGAPIRYLYNNKVSNPAMIFQRKYSSLLHRLLDWCSSFFCL